MMENEPIDQSNLEIPNKELNRLNKVLFFTLLGISVLLVNIEPFLLLLNLIGLLALTKSSGIEFYFAKQQYRNYKEFFWKRKGEWKEISKFTSLVLLIKSGKKTVVGQRMTSELSIEGQFYELYLMDAKHQRRLFVHNSLSRKMMDEIIALIRSQTHLELQQYNPQRMR